MADSRQGAAAAISEGKGLKRPGTLAAPFLYFLAIPAGKPVPTFPGIVLLLAAMSSFRLPLSATDGPARTGLSQTPRGDIRTPAFMPVGTAATV